VAGNWAAAVRPEREWSNISMVKTLLSTKCTKRHGEFALWPFLFFVEENHFKAASAAS
jgi:hypothetical protein